MSTKPPFRFQQFTLRDDRVAMKVGTDGVLLGAWAPIREAGKILDIGTGCGIIALMLAQRTAETDSCISAIEIDGEAASQAYDNFRASPWSTRMPQSDDEIHLSLQRFAESFQATQARFELAVCNPPFFETSYLPQDHRRRAARHCDLLSRESLFQQTANLLTDTGRFCLVLPSAQANSTIELARSVGFHLWSRTDVRPTTESEVKRVLLEFGPETDSDMSAKRTELVIETARHQYSDQYEALTKDFHLRYVSGQ